jgi:hypothetical protein
MFKSVQDHTIAKKADLACIEELKTACLAASDIFWSPPVGNFWHDAFYQPIKPKPLIIFG